MKSIADLHHGQLYAEARDGGGSCFRLTLPIGQPPQINLGTMKRPEEGHILLIETTKRIREFVTSALEAEGYHQVAEAGTASRNGPPA